jgi:hypothetical protein
MILYIKKHKFGSKPFHIFLKGGVGIGKTMTLMCIIQNMLRYYRKNIPNVDLLKPKVMALMYIGEVAFNINGMTIHLGLVIALEKKSMNSKH